MEFDNYWFYGPYTSMIFYLMNYTLVNEALIYLLFILVSFFIATMVGIVFSFGSRIMQGTTGTRAGKLYSADLIGSALGALLISVFILPLFGIYASCLGVGGLIAVVIAIIAIKPQYGARL